MSELHVEISSRAARTVAHCQGALDSAGIERLTLLLQPLFEEKKAVALILDGIVAVDHAGVIGLSRLRALALDRGGERSSCRRSRNQST